jgi:FkbM family methyltransferase
VTALARRWRHGLDTLSSLGPYAVSRARLAACAFGPAAMRHTFALDCDFIHGGIIVRARAEDFVAVDEVFRRGEYDGALAAIAPEQLVTVLDAGANIGCFAAAAFRRSAAARVLSIEPSGDTYGLLAQNCARNRGYAWTAVRAAVWPRTGRVRVSSGGSSTARRVSADSRAQVDAITLDEAVRLAAPAGRVSLCKMDIEGAEQQVLETSSSALARIDRIVVEVHPPASDARAVHVLLSSIYADVRTLSGRHSSKPVFYAAAPRDPGARA